MEEEDGRKGCSYFRTLLSLQLLTLEVNALVFAQQRLGLDAVFLLRHEDFPVVGYESARELQHHHPELDEERDEHKVDVSHLQTSYQLACNKAQCQRKMTFPTHLHRAGHQMARLDAQGFTVYRQLCRFLRTCSHLIFKVLQ